MRTVTLFAFGSRGDTQPLVALGQGLAARGHRVRVLAAKRYADLVTSAGLEYRTLDIDPIDLLTGEVGQQWLSSRNPVSFMRGFRRIIRPMAQGVLDQSLEAAQGSDAVLAPATAFVGYHVAEKLGIPTGFLHLQPGEPTRTAANPLIASGRSLGAAPLNRATYGVVEQATWQLMRSVINPWRRDTLGLANIPRGGPFRAARRQGLPVFCGYSETVVPRPPDWPGYVHLTGYWVLEGADESASVDPGLAAFVEDGPPPVYVGFGSMVPGDPVATRAIVRAAVREAGVRGVLMEEPLEGGGAGGPEGDDVYAVPGAPHGWLFPRMAAIVHHGGAGTTGAALRAGVPQIVCPFFSDQPFWGARVAALGVGAEPLPIRRMDVDSLAARLRQVVSDRAVIARASALGVTLRAEDGVAAGARAVDAWLDGDPRPPRC